MTLIEVFALLVLLAVAWRLAKFVVRAALLAAALGVVLWYAGAHSQRGETPGVQPGRVMYVTDGDTLTVFTRGDRERIRLLGIDAPESSSLRFGRPDCGGRAGERHLRQLARPGSRIRLATDPTSGDVRDRYDRLLAYADTRQGRDLGGAQVAAGMAVVYPYQQRRFSRLARYGRLEAGAHAGQRGAWSACHGDFHSSRP